ncbi:MAG: AAA family ATPase [Ignavibacteriaceae bacterium]|nr:AAA family ATPase [Ignavibacteriaceae bacterium]
MAILTENNALEYYNRLTLLIEKPDSYNEKVRHIRNILEALYKELTAEEDRYFSSIHSRANYVFQKYSVPVEIVNLSNQLRTFCNNLIHNSEMTPAEEDYKSCCQNLASIINHFSQIEIPVEILTIYKDLELNTLKKTYKSSNREITTFLRIVVKSVSALNKTSQESIYFDIAAINDVSGENISIRFWGKASDEGSKDFYSYAENIQAHQIINCFNLSFDPAKPDLYSSTGNTLIVLEPDFLIEAKEVASCFENRGTYPENFILSFILPVKMSVNMLKGSMVNSLLDKVLTQPEFDFETAIKECFKENAIQTIINLEEVNKLKESIRNEHLPQLQRFADSIKETPRAIEPTYYSASYGLTGRLDVVFKNEIDEDKIDIAELKSSNPPQFDVWKADKMQCVIYNLLLKSTYGNNRTGLTEIFYSRDNLNPRRNVVNQTFLEAQVLHCRNKIVQTIFELCEGDFSSLSLLNPAYFQPNGFFYNKLIAFYNVYSILSELEKAYFDNFLSFILKEMRIALMGGSNRDEEKSSDGFSSLWKNDPFTKKQRDSMLDNLELEYFDPKTGIVTLKRLNREISRFRTGEAVLIYPERFKDNPLKYEIMKGSLVSFGNSIIKIRLRNKQTNSRSLSKGNKFVIELDFIDSNYEEMCKNLFEFVSDNFGKKDLFLGLKEPGFEDNLELTRDDFLTGRSLNDNQFENLTKAIKSSGYFLLQGPPGTGKTSTILVNLVHYYLSPKGENRHITILAFTNRAVVEISDKLRSNNFNFINFSISSTSTEGITQITANSNALELKSKIQKTRVFISTAASFSKRYQELSSLINFDILIVDEASQLLEPQITGLLVKFNKVILIGDQNQLPAVSTQDEKTASVKNEYLNTVGIKDLRVSLFERLFKICKSKGWVNATGMLNTHFRMHSDIAQLVNRYYNNELIPGRDIQEMGFNFYNFNTGNSLSKLLKTSRIIFVDSGYSNEHKKNDREAMYISNLINFIKKEQPDLIENGEVGIITPWRSQIQNIMLKLGDDFDFDKLLIDTVERFQGSQREVIIISMASNLERDINLISPLINPEAVDKKLNVAVSRAREQLIIFGNNEILAKSGHYKVLIKKIIDKGKFIDAAQAERIFN